MALSKIGTNSVSDSAVTTAKINDDAVTGAKIENSPTIAANLAVTGTTTLTGKATAQGATEGFGVETIDIDMFDVEADKDAVVQTTKPTAGLFGQKTKPDKTFKEVFDLQDTEAFDPLGGA